EVNYMQHTVITDFVYLFPLTMPFSSDLALFNGTWRGFGVGKAAMKKPENEKLIRARQGERKKERGHESPLSNQTFLNLFVICCGSRGRAWSLPLCNGGTESLQSHELRGSCRTRANGYLKRRFWLP